jgi:chloride channel protein, CIC family
MKLPSPIKTMFAGSLIGILVLLLPQVMGTGRDTLNLLLNERSIAFTINMLLALAIAKMVATTISLGGGFVGGMFAPSLFVGAAVGRAFGEIATQIFPNVFAADPAAFAIVGMAATMTGVIRAPITAVILLFELTDDYRLILPILLTSVVCLLIVEKIAPQGLYHLGLARKGIRLVRGRDIDLMQTITVGEAMEPAVKTVLASLPLTELEAEFNKYNTHGLVVLDSDGLLFGIVTLQDLARAIENNDKNVTAGDLCTRNVITVTPNTPISEALRRIGTRDLGRLPVVERDNPRKVVGLLRRRDVVRAYELATQRKVEAATTESHVQLEAYSRAHVIELRVEAGSPADGQFIREVHWPVGSIIATVRRGNQVFVPHGNMQIQAGDLLTAVTADNQSAELLKVVRRPNQKPLS